MVLFDNDLFTWKKGSVRSMVKYAVHSEPSFYNFCIYWLSNKYRDKAEFARAGNTDKYLEMYIEKEIADYRELLDIK